MDLAIQTQVSAETWGPFVLLFLLLLILFLFSQGSGVVFQASMLRGSKVWDEGVFCIWSFPPLARLPPRVQAARIRTLAPTPSSSSVALNLFLDSPKPQFSRQTAWVCILAPSLDSWQSWASHFSLSSMPHEGNSSNCHTGRSWSHRGPTREPATIVPGA